MASYVTLRDADIRTTYDTMDYEKSSALDAFYIPVLSAARHYRRMSGYFSSTSIAVAAKGIASLIANGGTMDLICGPVLSNDDIVAFESVGKDSNALLNSYWERNFSPTEDAIREEYVAAMGWMLSHGLLRIKIAWVQGETAADGSAAGIFHMKTGIVEDVWGYQIAFSGSNNETASGWVDNVEQFDVYKSWVPGQESYLKACLTRFDRLWNNTAEKTVVLDLPEALARGLKSRGANFDKDKFVAKHYRERRDSFRLEQKLSLYDYQRDALTHWKRNNYQSLFEMATGTGKTRTAIACISEIQKLEKKLLVVISAPQIHLSRQWRESCNGMILRPYDEVVCDSTNVGWAEKAARCITGINSGFSLNKTLLLFVTHDTVSTERFSAVVDRARFPVLFIGDEVHGLGAGGRKMALRDKYRYRIGLSATPDRWFDASGTRLLKEYFGGNSFVLGLADALRHKCVCEYRYHPIFVDLTLDEREEYSDLTAKIVKLRNIAANDDEAAERLDRLLQRRADVIKNASDKMMILRYFVREHADIHDALVFCSPQQLQQVESILADANIPAAEYTYRQSAIARSGRKSERQQIVDRFVKKDLSVIIAVKCLDEGIDIPSAQSALLVSSSTNPREYIQRIGRVIRKSPGKTVADIYDFIVRPQSSDTESRDLYLKELNRAEYIAETSLEPISALGLLRKELETYGI